VGVKVSAANCNAERSLGLDEIAGNPDLVRSISPEAAAELILKCAAVQSALATVVYQANTATAPAQRDELLTVAEAADRLSLSTDYLYGNSSDLPFTVRIGSAVRFSSNGIDDFIRKRRGAS
jgi:hypothetical protein